MPKKRAIQLDLGKLASGHPPGITPAFGKMTAEAGSFLLERNGHKSGIAMAVQTPRKKNCSVTWPKLHADAARTHNDLPEAAEFGAYGIAFLLTEELTDFRVIERSWKGPGFDYWLGTGDEFPFQKAARLEVSGIVNKPDDVKPRVARKKKQTDRSAGSLPAIVAVIEFGTPVGVFEKR